MKSLLFFASLPILAILFYACSANEDYPFPFYDTELPFEDRLKDLVSRITLQEKVDQLAHGGASQNGPGPAIPRLGIKCYQYVTECVHGDGSAGVATCFPIALGLAASFDYEMLREFAHATSDEVRAKHNNATKYGSCAFHTGLSCFSPMINILRDPRWGRAQESYGEDPFLTGRLADAYVRGLQGDDPRYVEVNAGCKHFDAHSGPESNPVDRMQFDAVVGERDLRQTYLPAFKACVDAGSLSIMCSYNKLNGVPACCNKKLLTDILRTEWGFKGYVISDNPALGNIVTRHHFADSFTEAAVMAITAGEDLENTSPGLYVYRNLLNATRDALVSEEYIDRAISRIFGVRMKLGEFDPADMVPYNSIDISVIDSQQHRDLALECARKSIVLLKNEGNLLPLNPKAFTRIAVIGPTGNDQTTLLGNYSPEPSFVITPFVGIQTFLQTYNVKVAFDQGCNNIHCSSYNNSVVKLAQEVDLVIVCVGMNSSIEGEGLDRVSLNLPGQQEQMVQAIYATGTPIVLVTINAAAVAIGWSKQNIPAIVAAWYGGEHAGTAIADVFFGEYNPAGRLPATWYNSVDDLPSYVSYAMEGRTYRYFRGEPLFPFGYGLSYTNFLYSNLTVYDAVIRPCGFLKIEVTVSNIGKMDGDEVVQLYISNLNATVPVPIRQLSGFSRIHLRVGESMKVSFVLEPEQMSVVTDHDFQSVISPGLFSVYIGGQQPSQRTSAPSNVLSDHFRIEGLQTPLSKC